MIRAALPFAVITQQPNMKAILLTLAFAFSLTAFAQKADNDHKTPAEKAEHRTEQMVKELGLNASQQEKASSINLAYYTAMNQVNTIVEKDRDGRASVVKANRDNSLQQVLTPEQFAKMITLREERKAKKEADKKE